MTVHSRFGSALQAVAVAIVLVGAVVAGYAAVSASQSTPYMVQSEQVSAPGNERVVAYDHLTANQRRIFERALTGAAPVEKFDLTVFANSVVEYRGDYYAFALFVDEGGVGALAVAVGVVITTAGAGLFLVGRFIRQFSVNTPA